MNNTQNTSTLNNDDISDILEENGLDDYDFEMQTSNNNVSGGNENINREDLEEPLSLSQQASNQVIEDHLENSSENNSNSSNLLQENSPTLLVDESTIRFSGAEWFKEIQKTRVIIAGVGGIGSNVAFQLARMVPTNITLYDDDRVEMTNMAGQLYNHDDIGKTKVDAISDMIMSYTTMKQLNAIPSKFTSDTEPGDIMICGFDNMKARTTFFNSWLKHLSEINPDNRSKCLYIDGRLSMDTLQIFCITGDDYFNQSRYRKEFLFSDREAEYTICSMKQTTYLACMIGSLIVNLFTNFIANSLKPIIPYDLPFFTEYDAQNMLFQTEN